MVEAIKTSADERAMLQALREFKTANGHPAMKALLFDVAGVGTASEVDPAKYAAVIAACSKNAPAVRSFDSLSSLSQAVWDKRNKKPE